MSKKTVNFYTAKQIAELKSLKGAAAIEKFAKEHNRTVAGVMCTRTYYRNKERKNRKKGASVAAQTRKNAVTSVIKSSSRGEFVIPVSSVEVRNTEKGINLVFKY